MNVFLLRRFYILFYVKLFYKIYPTSKYWKVNIFERGAQQTFKKDRQNIKQIAIKVPKRPFYFYACYKDSLQNVTALHRTWLLMIVHFVPFKLQMKQNYVTDYSLVKERILHNKNIKHEFNDFHLRANNRWLIRVSISNVRR